jgi:hypothetical protein
MISMTACHARITRKQFILMISMTACHARITRKQFILISTLGKISDFNKQFL